MGIWAVCLSRRRAHNDNMLASAFLDRLLHQADTLAIEGHRDRLRDQGEA